MKKLMVIDGNSIVNRAFYGVSQNLTTREGQPIGIGGDPSGASAEKGETILRVSARELIAPLLEIRDW